MPLLQVSLALEVPPVATYAATVLWNYQPLFPTEPVDELENLATLATFTGSLDESWFYLVSVAIEARGAIAIPLMLDAIKAARANDAAMVIDSLTKFASVLVDLKEILQRLYENCEPMVFYNRIRPYLAGSENMADSGLPNGVRYMDGSGNEPFQQYSGGSNAQSSLIQFFDLVLGIEHRPTGQKASSKQTEAGTAPPPKHNFIHKMRKYMPGPHRRFLEHVSTIANIRDYVESHASNHALTGAYDLSLLKLREFRDSHIEIVTRYIMIPMRKNATLTGDSESPMKKTGIHNRAMGLAAASTQAARNQGEKQQSNPRGTGGTALIPFLKQARDETSEPSIKPWVRKTSYGAAKSAPHASLATAEKAAVETLPVASRSTLLPEMWAKTQMKTDKTMERKGHGGIKSAIKSAVLNSVSEHADGQMEIKGLAGTWVAGADSEGGLCHW
jgi:indoleamine 2,3-dioxygenase